MSEVPGHLGSHACRGDGLDRYDCRNENFILVCDPRPRASSAQWKTSPAQFAPHRRRVQAPGVPGFEGVERGYGTGLGGEGSRAKLIADNQVINSI